MTQQDIERGKRNAIISYLTIFGVIIAYFMNNEADQKSPFAGFHIRQSLGLWLTFWALGYIVGSFDSWFVSSGFYLFFAVLFIYGFIGATSGKLNEVPLLGKFYQKIFANFAN
ncbi:hypothetical protein [Seonamhaeicola marinus]|uniref:DUF4870 domain-containing protein n=1 Tax=Seonamhaeicola marinus TaxID=1912246 RepID=A0A5D0HKL9_9FLAO|nr:hypothetical protein [Seonamhaeicola marinus]TYA71510.1 hypothetical protein FUA24_18200 [Seonamhaeicola marinus]